MELPDTIRITTEVAQVLEALEVPYLVGGSIASSIHGVPRSTQDADLVADLRSQHAQPLFVSLSEGFYIEPQRVLDAIRRRASFNVIHHRTGLKIDIFVIKDHPLARQEMARRQWIALLPGQSFEIPVATPEDIVLQKLLWYEMENRISDRQWNDVLGVLKVQGTRLDFEYLKEWADRVEVGDLLRQACEDAGVGLEAH